MAQDYDQLTADRKFAASYLTINSSDEALRTDFSGASEPISPVAHMTWADTTNNLLKRRNAANTAWTTEGMLGVAHHGHLQTAGGTMTGDIAMGGAKVTGLGAPTANGDAARKDEVDLKAPIAAPSFTGDAQVNQDPAGNNSLVRRIWADGRYLKLAGGTMTALFSLFGDAVSALQAVTLQQLKTFVLFNTTTGHKHDGTDARRVRGTDLDSGIEVANRVPVASGAGVHVYKSTNQPLIFNYPVAYVWNTATTNNTWNSIDISAAVTADAYAAKIVVIADVAASFGHDYRFRANGLSHDTTQMAHTFEEGIGVTSFEVDVELSAAKVFQFNLRVSSGSPVVKIALLGYYRQVLS